MKVPDGHGRGGRGDSVNQGMEVRCSNGSEEQEGAWSGWGLGWFGRVFGDEVRSVSPESVNSSFGDSAKFGMCCTWQHGTLL